MWALFPFLSLHLSALLSSVSHGLFFKKKEIPFPGFFLEMVVVLEAPGFHLHSFKFKERELTSLSVVLAKP